MPCAIIGASPGTLGTARSQTHLRTVLLNTGMRVMPGPEVHVGTAAQKFADGGLTDGRTIALLGQAVAALVAWARRVTE